MTVDMRSFLQEIKKTNDVFTVKKRVSTKYEIAAVTEKLDGSKAALFENIKGNKFKLVSNLVGSRDRLHRQLAPKNLTLIKKLLRQFLLQKNQKFLHQQSFLKTALMIFPFFQL